MRRPTLMAALAAALALVGCTAKTPEGAACNQIGGVDQCPEGQRCGADGKCSVAAVACGDICSASNCAGQSLTRCVVDPGGVCTHTELQECTGWQACNPTAGACECLADCGAYRSCGQEDDVTGPSCVCNATTCTASGPMCSPNLASTITCGFTDDCYHVVGDPAPCGPDESCRGAPGAAECRCPDVVLTPVAEGGCATLGDRACNGSSVLTCAKPPGSQCQLWKADRDCATSSLVCVATGATAACQCPPVTGSGRTLYADPATVPEPGVEPTGADSDLCRFKTLQAALGKAAEGDVVTATGTTSPVEFLEGALTVGRGVTLTTADAVPTPANYVIMPSDGVAASALVTLHPGATISGFELRNRSATGSAIASACPLDTDTAAVSVSAVAVAGKGTVTPSAHFQHGVSHVGKCSLVLKGSIIEGASDSGVSIFPASPISLSMTGNTVRLNTGTEPFTINGVDRTAGGVLLRGEAPTAVVFNTNTIVGNQGDQVLVYMSGDVDLSAPNCQSANVFACYTAPGVGVSSFAQNLSVLRASWPKVGASLQPGIDYEVEPLKNLSGTGVTCPIFPATSCPQ